MLFLLVFIIAVLFPLYVCSLVCAWVFVVVVRSFVSVFVFLKGEGALGAVPVLLNRRARVHTGMPKVTDIDTNYPMFAKGSVPDVARLEL